MNQSVTNVFVEQPLASPGSAKNAGYAKGQSSSQELEVDARSGLDRIIKKAAKCQVE